MRNAQPLREPHADEAHLFVRVNRVVALRRDAPRDRQQHQRIEHDLGERRTDAHLADKRRAQAAEDAQIRQLDITADRIGHQIDVMAEFAERLDAVVLAEGRAARLEKRLGREHQDAHESLYLTEQAVVRLQYRPHHKGTLRC